MFLSKYYFKNNNYDEKNTRMLFPPWMGPLVKNLSLKFLIM